MKKVICLLLCLLLLLSLAACKKDAPAASDPSQVPPADTAADVTEPEKPAYLKVPICAISMPRFADASYAEDGTLVFRREFQDVAIVAPDAEPAGKAALKLLALIDSNLESSAELQRLALQAHADGSGSLPYFYHRDLNPMRIDEKVLSLYGSDIVYSGGVHPNVNGISVTYDMATGSALQLGDILAGAGSADAFGKLVIEDLHANRKEYQLFDGFEDTIQGIFGKKSDQWEDFPFWYLSRSGLCVYFAPYEIAPYVSGTITVEVPYAKLTEILRPDYLPPKLPASIGTMSAALAQDVELSEFTQFAEAILSSGGERFVLYPDDLVSNVMLEQGSWNADGSVFIPEGTVFMAATLCHGDAVMVQAEIPDTLPNLRLTYEVGGIRFSSFITQSGEDGSVFLMDITE